MISKVSARFWQRYSELPTHIQQLAHEKYLLWQNNPFHPSLRFKPFRGNMWSVRVGDHYRAVGYFRAKDTFVWLWIGTHEKYNQL